MMDIETRPSAAHRWTKCAAAPLFSANARVIPAENDAAREGTCAAWLAEQVLTGTLTHAASGIALTHPNGWQVDAEMAEHVQAYCDMIFETGGNLHVEKHVALHPLIEGTLDNAAVIDGKTLIVRDLKYGRRIVEADTPQLVIYAAAMYMLNAQVSEIWTEIYQPRGMHPQGIHRRVRWMPDELKARADWIVERAKECHQPNPTATPGPHCLYCDGASECQALRSTSVQVAALVESPIMGELTSDDMSAALDFYQWASKTVEAAAKAVEAEALARMNNGERFPGWGMVPRYGVNSVTAPREAIRALTGVDPVKTVPMGIGDLKAAGLTKEQIAMFTGKKQIGHKLQRLSNSDLTQQFKGATNDATKSTSTEANGVEPRNIWSGGKDGRSN